MSDRLAELEARVAALSAALEAVEGRLAALERSPARAAPRKAAAPAAAQRPAAEDLAALGGTVSLVGRTLVVLAGAFLLRALTDSGRIPPALGVALGLAYAGTWVVLSDRAAGAGRRASAGFHGASAVVIGFPLLFEAATRFRLLPPAAAAALLTVFTAVALASAARRRFEALAWLVALGGTATAVALMPVTARYAPPILYLVLLGVASLWLGYVHGWFYLRWPIAAVANLAVLVLATRAARAGAVEGPRTVVVVELVLLVLWLGSIAARTLLLDRPVIPFEVAQTAALLVVGLGGGAYVAARSGTGEAALGVASVAMGLAAYAVAFAFAEGKAERRRNFWFYSSVALVFVLAGAALALSAAALAPVLGVLAAAVGTVARRTGRRTLAAHAAAYGVAGIAAGGLLGGAAEALLSSHASWARPPAGALAALVLAAVAAWLTAGVGAGGSARERVPRLLLVAALAIGAAGVAVAVLVPPLAGGAAEPDPGAIATVRTGVLVAGAFLLALAGRSEAWREARWLVYPVLAGTGLKLLLEDVSRSRPATLFVAFAAYGAALLLVPRLRGSRRRTPPAAPEARAA